MKRAGRSKDQYIIPKTVLNLELPSLTWGTWNWGSSLRFDWRRHRLKWYSGSADTVDAAQKLSNAQMQIGIGQSTGRELPTRNLSETGPKALPGTYILRVTCSACLTLSAVATRVADPLLRSGTRCYFYKICLSDVGWFKPLVSNCLSSRVFIPSIKQEVVVFTSAYSKYRQRIRDTKDVGAKPRSRHSTKT